MLKGRFWIVAKKLIKKFKKKRLKNLGYSTSCNLNLSLSDTRSVNDIIIIHYSLVPLSTLFFFIYCSRAILFFRFFFTYGSTSSNIVHLYSSYTYLEWIRSVFFSIQTWKRAYLKNFFVPTALFVSLLLCFHLQMCRPPHNKII